MEEVWAIVNDEGEYWNNDFGWMTLEEGDEPISLFTTEEKEKYHLPMEGKWELQWDNRLRLTLGKN